MKLKTKVKMQSFIQSYLTEHVITKIHASLVKRLIDKRSFQISRKH